jgi:hypothetical protein
MESIVRSPLLPSLLLSLVALSGASAAGCNTTGDCTFFVCGAGGSGGDATGGTGGAGGGTGGTGGSTPVECVPRDASGPVAGGCGIFVATSGTDTGAGTKDSPVSSIQAAIALAKDGEKRVYLCAETFTETVTVDAGVTLFGALDCTKDWAYSGGTRTVLTAASDSIPLRIAAGTALALADIDITGPDATSPGGSSIAVIAESMATLSFNRSAVTAGLAMAGADGESFLSSAASGSMGSAGVNACLGAQAITPPAPSNRCGDIDSAGGSGGISEAIQGSAGNPGLPQLTDNGGAGETAAPCKLGMAGANGMDGQSGDGATGVGMINESGYMGVNGSDGTSGTTAQGGGGGGGAKGGSGASKCTDPLKASGASGGSGGSGGCGGEGGRGGQAGGSSIGIISLGATLTFTDTTITAKSGGAGGNGSDGQIGGFGGIPGTGGMVPPGASLLKAGCQGGIGGVGGTGGKGGGGQGGHSIGIAHIGAPPDKAGVLVFVASPGNGGTGDGMSDTTEGEKGIAAELHLF